MVIVKDNQDYDIETGLAMVGQRYYSLELCRFVQPAADASSLNLSSVNGVNLYSYVNNNPTRIAYTSLSVGGTSSGRMISSSGRIFSSIAESGSIVGGAKVSSFGSLGGSSFDSINWPKANSVAMTLIWFL